RLRARGPRRIRRDRLHVPRPGEHRAQTAGDRRRRHPLSRPARRLRHDGARHGVRYRRQGDRRSGKHGGGIALRQPPLGRDDRMKLAIGSGTAFAGLGNRVYADERAVAARLTWWKARGAEGVVCYDTLPDFYEAPLDRFRRLKRLLDDSGVAVPAFNALRKSLHLPDLADADERRLDRCLQVCEIFRPAVIDLSVCAPLAACSEHRPPPPSGATPETLRAVAARLRRFARACASLGAAVAIELHDEGIHDTAERCLTLLALIDAPNVGVNPD